jgi:hypothetical protein
MSTRSDRIPFEGLGLATKFCSGWTRASGTPWDLNSLAEDPDLLGEIVEIVRGTHPTFRYRIIDRVLEGSKKWLWRSLRYHRPAGLDFWDDSRIKLVFANLAFDAESLSQGIPIENWFPENAADASIHCFLERHRGCISATWDPRFRYLFAGTKYCYPEPAGPHYGGYLVINGFSFEAGRSEWQPQLINTADLLKESDVMVTVV